MLIKRKRKTEILGDGAIKSMKEKKVSSPSYSSISKSVLVTKSFAQGEFVPSDILEKARKDGVVQRDSDGTWRIVSIKSGKYWAQRYKTKESASKALAAYHAGKFNKIG